MTQGGLMTDLRTAAQQALASLEEWADAYPHRADDDADGYVA